MIYSIFLVFTQVQLSNQVGTMSPCRIKHQNVSSLLLLLAGCNGTPSFYFKLLQFFFKESFVVIHGHTWNRNKILNLTKVSAVNIWYPFIVRKETEEARVPTWMATLNKTSEVWYREAVVRKVKLIFGVDFTDQNKL